MFKKRKSMLKTIEIIDGKLEAEKELNDKFKIAIVGINEIVLSEIGCEEKNEAIKKIIEDMNIYE